MKISINQPVEKTSIDNQESEITKKRRMQTEKDIVSLKMLEESGRLSGEFTSITDDVYHDESCPADSRSMLMLARTSRAKYAAKKKGLMPWKTSPAKEFGKMFHKYILEPDFFDDHYCLEYVEPRPEGNAQKLEKNGGVKEAYQAWKRASMEHEAQAEKEGKSIYKKSTLDQLQDMKKSLMSIPNIKDILTDPDAEFENTYFFNCPKSGRLMKFKPDIIIKSKRIIIDLKTADDASPLGFGKAIANHYYDVQAAQYLNGAETIFGGKWVMGFIAVEKEAPHVCGSYALGDAERELGQEILSDACRILNEMPEIEKVENSYTQGFESAQMPAWSFTGGYR